MNRSIARGGCDGNGGGEVVNKRGKKGLVMLIPRTECTGMVGTPILSAAIGVAGFLLGRKFNGRW